MDGEAMFNHKEMNACPTLIWISKGGGHGALT